jgi:hypothetical protein
MTFNFWFQFDSGYANINGIMVVFLYVSWYVNIHALTLSVYMLCDMYYSCIL